MDAFERFAITGGMPRYLAALAAPESLADVICTRVLHPDGALFAEGRTLLEELREPKVYFSVLQALAGGDKESAEIAAALRSDAQKTSKYLAVLEDMRLVSRRLPIGAEPGSRGGHWHLRDPFLRFWYRFVFPYADDLETGLQPRALWEAEIAPVLADHVAVEFEEHVRQWVRATQAVSRVGPWWGNALNALRRSGERSSEEIDAVGVARRRVTLVAEARWRTSPMGIGYLRHIEDFKLPVLRQSTLKVASSPRILLVSRGGYTDALRAEAAGREDLTLVGMDDLLADGSGARIAVADRDA